MVRVLFTAYHDDRVFLQACIPPTETKSSSSYRSSDDVSSLKSQSSQKKKPSLVILKNTAIFPIDFLQDDVISSRYVLLDELNPI